MPIQQTHVDLHSAPQKLSKIETLRLARNYIVAMSQTLQEGRPMDITRFIKILSRELSQTTANLLSAAILGSVAYSQYNNVFLDCNDSGYVPEFCMNSLNGSVLDLPNYGSPYLESNYNSWYYGYNSENFYKNGDERYWDSTRQTNEYCARSSINSKYWCSIER